VWRAKSSTGLRWIIFPGYTLQTLSKRVKIRPGRRNPTQRPKLKRKKTLAEDLCNATGDWNLTLAKPNRRGSISIINLPAQHSSHSKNIITIADTLAWRWIRCTVSFETRLENTVAKLSSGNIVARTPAVSARTLRRSALGLVYPSGWTPRVNSAHASKLDVQPNITVRLTSGTTRSTPAHWLRILAGNRLSSLSPTTLRRANALIKEFS